MTMHFADIVEAVAATQPDAPAIRHGSRTITWREYEGVSARLSAAFVAAGLGPSSTVGLYLRNRPEYLQASLAAYKHRGMPVNINYRYTGDELAYLLEDSGAEGLVFGDSLAHVVAELPESRRPSLLVQVDEIGESLVAGAVAFDEFVAVHDPADPIERAEDDHHILYTGGTTGLPKGVLYEFGPLLRELAAMVGPVAAGTVPRSIDDLVAIAEQTAAAGTALSTAVLPPLMHGTGMALAFMTHMVGGSVSLLDGAGFDPVEALDVIERDRARVVNVVGDAFARPMVARLDDEVAAGRRRDLSSVEVIMSSGAMFSSSVKQALLRHLPDAMVIDTLAASEGAMGTSIATAAGAAGTAAFTIREGVRVLDDDDRPVEPGSGQAGWLAVASRNPVGYHNDPEKTARTFRVIDGIRYSFPGDHARIEADGTVTLLGRGNHCINTGGEKVYPEEVEETLKTDERVEDALVFGVDDDRWGQRIEAVVATSAPLDVQELIDLVKRSLAGFKAPKHVHIVDVVPRAPNGKADYAAARALASGVGSASGNRSALP